MLDICPYYYKDKKKDGVLFTFEYCHKPNDETTCPTGRGNHECEILRLKMEFTDEGRKWINRK